MSQRRSRMRENLGDLARLLPIRIQMSRKGVLDSEQCLLSDLDGLHLRNQTCGLRQ